MNDIHQPVLLTQVARELSPKHGEAYLDLTAGYGGHAKVILKATQAEENAVLVDRDSNAIKVLTEMFPSALKLHLSFNEATDQLVQQGRTFDIILIDLGVSSPHVDIASRGFSFRLDGPLDMRMDQRQALTAKEVVNNWSEEQLRAIISNYGEEPKAKRIVQAIANQRPFETTLQLANCIEKAIGRKPGVRTHPATKTFQAIRIAVNDELGQISAVLPRLPHLLNRGGRVGIISFHSLEDRLVKQYLKTEAGERYDAELLEITKRPVSAEPDELVFNPRSRSAKLRVAVKK